MWFLFLKYFSDQVSLFFFFGCPFPLYYLLRSCKIISFSQPKTKREKEWLLLLEIKISSNYFFLNQLLISFLILIFYVYVLLQIYRRLLWLIGFHRVHFFFFIFFFVFFKESFWWDPSVTHENCLAAFGPTIYDQNQVKKRLCHPSVSHMIW